LEARQAPRDRGYSKTDIDAFSKTSNILIENYDGTSINDKYLIITLLLKELQSSNNLTDLAYSRIVQTLHTLQEKEAGTN